MARKGKRKARKVAARQEPAEMMVRYPEEEVPTEDFVKIIISFLLGLIPLFIAPFVVDPVALAGLGTLSLMFIAIGTVLMAKLLGYINV